MSLYRTERTSRDFETGINNKEQQLYKKYIKKQTEKQKYIGTEVVLAISRPVGEKSTFQSNDNTTLGADILCPAVYISEVRNKDGMRGKVSNTSRANLFLFFTGHAMFSVPCNSFKLCRYS